MNNKTDNEIDNKVDNELLKIVYVYADRPHELNTSIYQCIQPANALAKAKLADCSLMSIETFALENEQSRQKCEEADIIVIERNLFWLVVTRIQEWQDKGKIVYGVFDDAYHLITEDNPSYPFWHDGLIKLNNEDGTPKVDKNGNQIIYKTKPHPMSVFKIGLETLNGFYTPSKLLTKDFSFCNLNSIQIPNFINTNYYNLKKHSKRDIVIGWAGSGSHLKGVRDSGVFEALEKITKKYNHVKVLIGGDKKVYDSLDISNNQKIFQYSVSIDKYPEKILSNITIGLAPLNGEYDMRRSWLKPLEYSLMGIPWITTYGEEFGEMNPYQDLVEYGTMVEYNVLQENLFYKSKAWYDALFSLVGDDRVMAEKKEQAMEVSRPFALTKDIDKNVGVIYDSYISLAEQEGFEIRKDKIK